MEKIKLMKAGLILIISTSVIIGCSNKEFYESEMKDEIIKKFIAEEQPKSKLKNKKIIILKTEYCEEIDCDEYFKGYEKEIVLYTKEDLFMRGIREYLVINGIDPKSKKIEISLSKGVGCPN